MEEKKNNGVGRENGNEESGTKCETWEEKKGMDSHGKLSSGYA